MLFKLFLAIACLASLAASATVKERFARNTIETSSTNSHQLGSSELDKESHPKLGLSGNLNSSPTEKAPKEKRDVDNKQAELGKPPSQPSSDKSTPVLGGVNNPNSQLSEHPKQKRESNDKSSDNRSPTSESPNKLVGEVNNHNSNIPTQHPKKKREVSTSPATVASNPSEKSHDNLNESAINPYTKSPTKQKRESGVSTSTTESANHALEQSKIIQISKGQGTDKKEVIKTTP